MEIVLNRKGQSNGICPLYFDGAINYYSELPLPNDSEGMSKIYKSLQDMRTKASKVFFSYKLNKNNKELHSTNIFSKFAALLNKLKYKRK